MTRCHLLRYHPHRQQPRPGTWPQLCLLAPPAVDQAGTDPMLPGEFANSNARFKGKRHHLPAERVIVRTSPLRHNLDPLHRSSHCGCHSGCLTSVISHVPKLNAMPRAAQGAEIGRLPKSPPP